MTNVVVAGAGQAGAALVAKLRAEGFMGNLTLIGEEHALPYQRPPLSKAYLLGEMPLERLYLRPATFYAENRIDLHLDTRVDAIDRADKAVVAGGHAIPYDHLVLATGAVARRLPAKIGGALPGVHVVRDLNDIDRLAPDLTAGRKVLVVGGGYIGLEAAAVCRKKGLEVVLIEAADRILGRVAAPETAAYFRALHKDQGVDLREGIGLTALKGADRVAQAELSDGTLLDVDLAIVGIGITPATALAEAAGLEIENGIKTDAFGRTSDPAIWAAGDCASFPYRGGRLRLESVQNAIDQAEAVAKNIMGADAPYVPQPWFWSDQYDVKLQIAGLNTGYTDVVVRGGGATVSHWYYRDGVLLAVDAMNDSRAYMVGKRLIEAGKSPAAAAIADTEADLKALLRA